MGFIEEMTPWHWLALAGALLIIEVLVPATFFLWIGTAAAITGLVFWVVDISAASQLLMFSALSVVSIILHRVYLMRNPPEADSSTLSRRGEQYIGKTYMLVTPIKNGVGKAKVEDSLWRVEGEDLPEGAQVTVTGVSGSSLIVKSTN